MKKILSFMVTVLLFGMIALPALAEDPKPVVEPENYIIITDSI